MTDKPARKRTRKPVRTVRIGQHTVQALDRVFRAAGVEPGNRCTDSTVPEGLRQIANGTLRVYWHEPDDDSLE